MRTDIHGYNIFNGVIMKLSKIALACLIATGTMAPQFASADDDFEFHGYARFGASYEADGNQTIGADGATGNAAGRLGNEGMGGEIMFTKNFVGENGTKWDVNFMIEDWYDIALKQAYAGATNVFVSQPNAYIWAGRTFHSRVQQNLNDYYVAISDAQGAGIKNLELGFANFEFGAVGSNRLGSGNGSGDYNGNYALTSKLSGITLGQVSMDLLLNVGFADSTADTVDSAVIAMAKFSGWNQNVYIRYSENTEANVLVRGQDLESIYLSLDGSFSLGANTGLEYLTSYHDIDNVNFDEPNNSSRTAVNLIARVTHSWNDIHSTWIEAGTVNVDFDDNDESSASKITFSQNIAIGGVTWARPMLRFYVTAGTEKAKGSDDSTDPVIVGAMWEAWW